MSSAVVDESQATANLALQDRVELRAKVLVRYQNNAYADRYRKLVQQSLQAEESKAPGMQGFAEAVARYYYKLLAYKDEYEVARLYREADFRKQLEQQFEGEYQIRFHMAPADHWQKRQCDWFAGEKRHSGHGWSEFCRCLQNSNFYVVRRLIHLAARMIVEWKES